MSTPTGRWSCGRKGGFCYDAGIEALLTLRAAARPAWAALQPALKIQLACSAGCQARYEDSLQACAPAVEWVLHDACAAARLHNAWFERTPEPEARITALAGWIRAGGLPLPARPRIDRRLVGRK